MRYFLFALFCLLLVLSHPGQCQSMVWQKRFHSADPQSSYGSDEVFHLAPHPGGGLVASGTAARFSFQINGNTVGVPFLCRFRANGDTTRFISSNFSNIMYPRPAGLCYQPQENLFWLVGYRRYVGGSQDMEIVRYDTSLNEVSRMLVQDTLYASTSFLVPAPAGDVYLVGLGRNLRFQGVTDAVYVARLRSPGLLVWSRTYAVAEACLPGSVEDTPQGGLLIGAIANGAVWKLELDSNGAETDSRILWQSFPPVLLNHASVRRLPGPERNLFVTASTYSSSQHGQKSMYGQYRSNGARIYAKVCSTQFLPFEFYRPIGMNDDGTMVWLRTRKTTTSTSDDEGMYLERRSTGEDTALVWTVTVRRPGAGRPSVPKVVNATLYTENEEAYIGGAAFVPPGQPSLYVAKVAGFGRPFDPTPVKEGHGALSGGLALYPNPAAEAVTVRGKAHTLVSLYSVQGKLLHAARLNPQGLARLDVSGLPKGIYLVRGQHGAARLVKE